jgi:hypothetical protein
VAIPNGSPASTIPSTARCCSNFATWHVPRHLRTTAERVPIGPYRNVNGRSQLRQSAAFLLDLATSRHSLDTCTQADIDRWYATATPTEQNLVRPFLTWALRRQHSRSFRLPPVVRTTIAPISSWGGHGLVDHVIVEVA